MKISRAMNEVKKVSIEIKPLLALIFCAAVLGACAPTKGAGDDKYANIDFDPIEPLNRGIFQFNYAVDTVLLKPVTQLYEFLMPDRGELMVSNAVNNLGEPVTFANSVVQLDATNSFSTLWRFMINSTFGLAGTFDVASEIGLKNRPTGLGDTFAIYGADTGPYIMIPVIGPSNIRDGLGRLGDMFTDPITYTNDPVLYSVIGVKTIDTRHRNMKLLNDIYNNSLDPYSTMRSIFTQHREAAVKKAIEERRKSMESGSQCVKDPSKK